MDDFSGELLRCIESEPGGGVGTLLDAEWGLRAAEIRAAPTWTDRGCTTILGSGQEPVPRDSGFVRAHERVSNGSRPRLLY